MNSVAKYVMPFLPVVFVLVVLAPRYIRSRVARRSHQKMVEYLEELKRQALDEEQRKKTN